MGGNIKRQPDVLDTGKTGGGELGITPVLNDIARCLGIRQPDQRRRIHTDATAVMRQVAQLSGCRFSFRKLQRLVGDIIQTYIVVVERPHIGET